MEYTEIINLVIKILAGVASILISMLVPKVKAWLEGKIGADELDVVIKYIKEFVAAAEQQLKQDDPTGEARKAYVVTELAKLGIVCSDEINALIESAVWSLNAK